MRPGVFGAAALLLIAVGCDAPERRAASDPPPRAAPPARSGTAAGQGTWTVAPEGMGPPRVGMSLAALAPHLASVADTAEIGAGCGYVSVRGAPDSVGFMMEGRRLVRVDVFGGRTAAGARIGDAEERIRGLYPGVRTEPHKYTDGHYLVALPNAPADTLHRIVFETDGRAVQRYRAGVFPPVAYVEGCA